MAALGVDAGGGCWGRMLGADAGGGGPTEAALGVVMAARGYPGAYARHTAIGGVAAAAAVEGVRVFHAGTDLRDGVLVSSGGRVLTVVGMAADLRAARDAAYAGVDAVVWPEGFCRRDIGWRALGVG